MLGADRSEFEIDDPSQNLFIKAVLIKAKLLQTEIKTMELPTHQPVVLVCSDGKQSLKSAESLTKDGYINVFVVKGGLKGLIKEIVMDREESRGGML